MRRIAEPDLKRMARQAAHTAHENIVEHDVPKQLTLDGLRSDVPYAYHSCKTSHHMTIHNASYYTSNRSCCPVPGSYFKRSLAASYAKRYLFSRGFQGGCKATRRDAGIPTTAPSRLCTDRFLEAGSRGAAPGGGLGDTPKLLSPSPPQAAQEKRDLNSYAKSQRIGTYARPNTSFIV